MLSVWALELSRLGMRPLPAHIVMLLFGALMSVAVAAASLLLDRIKLRHQPKTLLFAGRAVPYRRPLRPRLNASPLTIAALFSTAAFVAAIGLPSNEADPAQGSTSPPDLSPIALPAVGAIGPGAGIYVDYADGSGGMGCTAGFLVHTSTGESGVLTAGHCNRPGKPNKVMMNLAGILPYAALGTFSRTVSEGVRTDQHDIGLITLDGDNVPQNPAIAASLPVSGVTTKLRIGQQLCKFGISSGETTCGQIVRITDSKVTFSAPGQCGDSGGPVYLMKSDGTASAVGIHIRGGNPDNPKAGCSAPAKFSVAELLQPWLDKWKLTAVTAQARPR